ncbi:hypothetical protein ACNTMW_11995 [Planosporangium sp. 12N6]|uniref:hypothetical protein n=1 Tax=Planosporangium spinosum TaxID=3402278 RepID=UPI003CE9C2F0
MLIDCDTCRARGQACEGCVVNMLFGPAHRGIRPDTDVGADDEAERRALQVLADAGFEVTVLSREDSRPRLRLVPPRRRGHHAA